jgi:signal transduction histidine kinase/ligand-binding sensor domain-containing protein/AraC-like DNA-binding protein/ActR/RegA family two-component response regulator
MNKYISTLSIACWAACHLFAQKQLPFSQISVADGLADARVYSILSDREGCLWFGTHNGLTRYYGNTHKNYLEGQIIFDLLEDKKRGCIWIASLGGGLQRFDPVTEKIVSYTHTPDNAKSIPCNTIDALYLDKDGRLWLGNFDCGLILFEPEMEKFTGHNLTDVPLNESNRFKFNSVHCIVEDEKEGVFWLGAENGIYRFDKRYPNNLPKRYRHPNGEGTSVFSLVKTSDHMLWASTYGNGLTRLNTLTGEWTSYPHDLEKYRQQRFDFNISLDVLPKSDHELWTYSSDWELSIFDTRTFTHTKVRLPEKEATGDIAINGRLYTDAQNRLWIARNADRSVAVFDPNTEIFRFHPIPNQGCLMESYNRVTDFAESPGENHLYLTTAGCTGLHSLRKEGLGYRLEKTAVLEDREENNVFMAVAIDKTGGVWVGAEVHPNRNQRFKRPSFWRYDPATNFLKIVRHRQFDKIPVQEHNVSDLATDAEGRLWIAADYLGLVEWDLNRDTLILHKLPCEPCKILEIKQDKAGRLLLPTDMLSLLRFEPKSRQFQSFLGNPRQEDGWRVKIAAVEEDNNGIIWISTEGNGVCLFDPEQGKVIRRFTEKDGLAYPKTSSLTKDLKGQMWVATEKGLCRYDEASQRFATYAEEDGLQSAFLYELGVFAASDGAILLGQSGGFNYYPLKNSQNDQAKPKTVFTFLKVFEKERAFPKNLNHLEEVTLRYDENYLNVGFATLNFTHPEKNRYQYKMEGLDEVWTLPADGRGYATYTNLSPGSYTLLVRGADHQGAWSEPIALKIRILPPWWRSFWAYLVYFLAAAGMVFWLWKFQLNRRLAQEETRRLKELDELKTRLYANVTHEFRTPLTLIIGLAKRSLQNASTYSPDEMKTAFQSILQNGHRLLNLVNQMLDLRKLEAGSLKPRYVQGDAIALLRYLTESFSSMAQNRNIRLQFEADADTFRMDYDKDKLTKIISNLLSNAFKFTPAGGRVNVETYCHANGNSLPKELIIKVKDTGVGIEAAHLPHIFDRFYQADDSTTRRKEGAGIGLALTKELVEMLDGRISVESIPQVGTCFTLSLPIHFEAEPEETEETEDSGAFVVPFEMPATRQAEVFPSNSELPRVLIIEDNEEVARFIASSFGNRYAVGFAENGRTGIEKAFETIPDLVVSDVMMPEKDGFEVCQTLKTDERTSHVPVIILTAKADFSDRIEGLKRGADAYLSKPFNEEELNIQAERLLHLRRQLQKRYSNLEIPVAIPAPANEPTPKTATFDLGIEDSFMQKVLGIIHEHLEDPGFTAELLYKKAGMGHSQFHRKLSALTDKTAVQLIRELRLNKARTLLKTTNLTIAEIAYQTGFNDPGYFTRMFSKEEGLTPTEFREQAA